MKASEIKKALEADKCIVCGGQLGKSGITIGGWELWGCTNCHLVYWKEVK